MRSVLLTGTFIKSVSAFDASTQEKIHDAIALFHNPKNDRQLRVHKLHGKLKEYYGFSVTTNIRIVFKKTKDQIHILLTIGTHDDVYR